MYPKDVQIPPGEEWYYELDGRAHGPLTRADLEDLLNRSGDTASEARVRQGTDGPWNPFRSGVAAVGAARTTGSSAEFGTAPAHSVGQPSAHPPRTPAPRSDFRGLLRDHWDICIAIGVWMLLNVIFLCWPQFYARERHYLQTLRAIEAEVQELRAKPASDADWRQFAVRTRATLAPIVSDLKKSASSSQLIRQQLLWSARDLIPRTLGPRTQERDEQERLLKQYLDGAQRKIENQ